MSLMIPFFLSSPFLPHIFLSPTLTFLQAPLHFPHDPLTALSLFPLHFSTVPYLHTNFSPSPPSLPSWSPSQSPVPSLRTSSYPPPFTPLLALGANYSAHKVFLISFSDTFNPRILLILGYFTLNLPTLNSRIPYTWTFYFLILYTEPFNLEFLIVRYFTLEPRTLIYPQPFNLRYFTPNLPILHTLTLNPLALSYFTLEPLTFRYFTLEPLTIRYYTPNLPILHTLTLKPLALSYFTLEPLTFRYFTLELLTFRYFTLEP